MKTITASDIAEMSEAIEIPEWCKQELDKRSEAYHANPSKGSPWEEVKKRILGLGRHAHTYLSQSLALLWLPRANAGAGF